MRKTAIIIMCLISGAAACEEAPTEPRSGTVILESLAFARSSVSAGEALVLTARTKDSLSDAPLPVLVSTSSGQNTTVLLNDCPRKLTDEERYASVRYTPYDRCSDEELAAIVGIWDNLVSIGFKEAGAEKGTDKRGYSITSEETVDRMKQWVRDQGVTITYEAITVPAVFGTVPAEAELVGLLRSHENVDYFNPSGPPGEPEVEPKADDIPEFFLTVLLTDSDHASDFTVRAGDVVTAEYRQPDGSVLNATVSIR